MHDHCRTIARLFLFFLLTAAVPATAQVVGRVTNISQGATVSQGGATQQLRSKASVSSGDLIKTDPTGQVQIVFIDRTRIVVGPSSELLIENFTRSSGKKASKFAVQAVGGTFRFLSGRSPKAAYELRTPTATMGIRGTEFDFAVDNRRLTNLVTFTGQVRICTRSRNCARVSGGCAVVVANRSRISQPETIDARNSLLRENFPYVVSQDTLGQDYRVQVEACGDVGTKVTTKKSVPKQRIDRADRIEGADEGAGGGYSEAADES